MAENEFRGRTMAIRIYNYVDYKDFIRDWIHSLANKGRGERKKIATQLNCQMSFVTHVLSGDKDFNHEQIMIIGRHFCLSDAETDYLLCLLSFNRSGTQELKKYYRKNLESIRLKNEKLKTRLKGESSLKFEDEVMYYSNWIFAAVHMGSTISRIQDFEKMAEVLKIDKSELLPVVQKLNQMGLINFRDRQIRPGNTRLYLDGHSPLIQHMHSSWRNKIIGLLSRDNTRNLHYTNCFSVSKKDFVRVKEILVQTIAATREVIGPSPEESLAVITMDLHDLG